MSIFLQVIGKAPQKSHYSYNIFLTYFLCSQIFSFSRFYSFMLISSSISTFLCLYFFNCKMLEDLKQLKWDFLGNFQPQKRKSLVQILTGVKEITIFLIAHRVRVDRKFFNPIWAYWACFAPGSSARNPFFPFLSKHTVRDAPPWGTWLRTLHWWRKVGRLWKKKPWDSNPQTSDYEVCALLLCNNCGPMYGQKMIETY